jgi:hypothetical protein
MWYCSYFQSQPTALKIYRRFVGFFVKQALNLRRKTRDKALQFAGVSPAVMGCAAATVPQVLRDRRQVEVIHILILCSSKKPRCSPRFLFS